MSRLEALPNELIEAIFFECLNLSLPRASVRLGDALSSTRTKLTLVRRAFASNAMFNIDSYCEVSCILWTGDAYTTEDAIGKLQSDILQCRWMTWEFLRVCMEHFITQTLVREFRDQALLDADLEPIKESVFRGFVHKVLYTDVHLGSAPRDEDGKILPLDYDQPTTGEEWDRHFEEREPLYDRIRNANRRPRENPESTTDDDDELFFDAGFDYLDVSEDAGDAQDIHGTIITSSLVTSCWKLPGSSNNLVAIGISRRTGVVIIGSTRECEGEQHMMRERSNRWRSLYCASGACVVPEKLLRGPWTEEKLSFLEAVLEAEACLAAGEQERTAEEGLFDAIREDNYRAVDLLVAESLDAKCTEHCSGEGVYVEPSFNDAQFDFSRLDFEDRPCVTSTKPRSTLDVAPSTEHLRVAVTEQGCLRMIVRRLLFARSMVCGGKSIDRKDPVVAAWIANKNSEGDDKGKWLQDQLDKSNNLHALKDAELERRRNRTPSPEWGFGSEFDVSDDESLLFGEIDFEGENDADGENDDILAQREIYID